MNTYLFYVEKRDYYEVKAKSKEEAEKILEETNDLNDYWRDDLTEAQPEMTFGEQIE